MPLSCSTKKIFADLTGGIFMSRRVFFLPFICATLPVQSMQFSFKYTSSPSTSQNYFPSYYLYLCNDDEEEKLRKGKNEKIAFSFYIWKAKESLRHSRKSFETILDCIRCISIYYITRHNYFVLPDEFAHTLKDFFFFACLVV
jgi:hypothetical protein